MPLPLRSVALRSLLALALAALASSCTRDGVPRPNILLVSIDSLRGDHVHASGYPRETTPAIDALARDGVLFRNAIAPSAWTLPSHLTLHTSLPPVVHRVENSHRRLGQRALTLAEVLRATGYDTAAVVGGPFLRASHGYAQGFNSYDESVVTAATPTRQWNQGATSPVLVDRALAWLRDWRAERAQRPFFFFLHLWDVHYDYAPPPPYDRMFDPDYAGTLTSSDLESNPRINRDMPRRDLEHLIALYDGEIRFTDDHLGRVFAWLEEAGVREDTIVIVTADHGDEFFEHGRKGHRKALFDESVRVPLVLRYPRRVPGGQVIPELVRLMDVAPTLLSLAAVERPEGFGVSTGPAAGLPVDLSSWLLGEEPAQTFPRIVAFNRTTTRRFVHESVHTQSWKLIRSQSEHGVAFHFFDLTRDAGEQNDLIASKARPRALAWLEKTLRTYRRHWLRAEVGFAAPHRLDHETEAKLRALGYVD
jgi:arylsulfatase A-like enzyme